MLFSCTDELPVINKLENLDEIPSITAVNIEMSYTKKGYLQGRLFAKKFQTFDDVAEPHTDFPEGIKIVLYNEEDNKIKAEMVADSAIYYQTKNSWVAMSNVVIKNINGTTLTTETLYGDEKEKKIFTNKLVNITQADGNKTTGKQGFESNTEFTIYKFINSNAEIYLKEEAAENETNNSSKPDNMISKSQNPNQPKKLQKPKNKKLPKHIPKNIKKPKNISKK